MTSLVQYLLLSVIGGAPATLAALLAYSKGRENELALRSLRVALNGRVDELVARTGLASHAAGRAEGVEAERARPDG